MHFITQEYTYVKHQLVCIMATIFSQLVCRQINRDEMQLLCRLHRYSLTSSTLLLPLPCYAEIGRLQISHLSLRKGILIVQRIIALSPLLVHVVNSLNILGGTASETTFTTITSSLCQHWFRAGHSLTLNCCPLFTTLCPYLMLNVRSA